MSAYSPHDYAKARNAHYTSDDNSVSPDFSSSAESACSCFCSALRFAMSGEAFLALLLAVATQISGSLPPRGPPPWAHTQDSTPPSCDPKTSHYEAFPSSPQRPARCISCRRGARRSRPLLSGRRDVSLAAAEHDDRPQGHPSPPHPRLHLLLSRSLRPEQ